MALINPSVLLAIHGLDFIIGRNVGRNVAIDFAQNSFALLMVYVARDGVLSVFGELVKFVAHGNKIAG